MVTACAAQVSASAANLPEWPLVEAEVLTATELDRQNALPSLPELVGVAEVAELLKVSRQRASALARSESVPLPVAALSSGPVDPGQREPVRGVLAAAARSHRLVAIAHPPAPGHRPEWN